MADWELSQLAVQASPAASTDYQPLLDTTDHSTPPAGAGGSDKRATIASVVNSVTDFAPSGLTGAVAVSRYVGATASGAPVSGTFAVGDFVVDQSGTIWLCTTAGSPGTWVALVSTTGTQTVGGAKTFTANLVVQVPSSYANGIFSGPGDGAQYSNFNLADDVLPLDQNPGGHYWAFSHRADAPAHRLVIFNYNGAGHYTNAFQITEAGAVSTLNNVLDDSGGNATLAGTLNLAAGTATLAPLKLASGTLLTAAAAGAAEFDGTAFYLTAAASSRQVVDAEQFTCLSSSYTLANSTSAQKLFNASANGALTVQGSTTYYFECEFDITGLSASAHTVSFGLGGTATYTSVKYVADRLDSSTAFSTAQAWTKQVVTTAAATALTAAGVTTTGFAAMIRGYVRVNAGGTLIPQVTQGTASAAAVVSANSWARLTAVGSSAVASVGDWS